VNDIRGVESGGVLGSLLARKLIATAGRKSVIGRPILYKTTKEFLLRFGLKDLAELPSMEEFEKMAAEIEEMEPEVVASDAYDAASEEAADAEGREDIPLNWEELPEPDELDENAPLPTNHSGKRETTLEAPTAASALSNEPRPAESGLAEPEPAESEPAEPGPCTRRAGIPADRKRDQSPWPRKPRRALKPNHRKSRKTSNRSRINRNLPTHMPSNRLRRP
jgi:segregation and condensation protein B